MVQCQDTGFFYLYLDNPRPSSSPRGRVAFWLRGARGHGIRKGHTFLVADLCTRGLPGTSLDWGHYCGLRVDMGPDHDTPAAATLVYSPAFFNLWRASSDTEDSPAIHLAGIITQRSACTYAFHIPDGRMRRKACQPSSPARISSVVSATLKGAQDLGEANYSPFAMLHSSLDHSSVRAHRARRTEHVKFDRQRRRGQNGLDITVELGASLARSPR